MNILYISCSPRGAASESSKLARKIIEAISTQGRAEVRTRNLGDGHLAHVDASYAEAQHAAGTPAAAGGSARRSDELIQELEQADVLVIGTPMHNLSIPSVLKAWLDHVVRASRTFQMSAAGKRGVLADRPVYIAVASGGVFSGEHARQPDFLTPYLRAILPTIGLHDITFFSVEGTGRPESALAETRAQSYAGVDAHFDRHMRPGPVLNIQPLQFS